MKYAVCRLSVLFLLFTGFLCVSATKALAQGSVIEQYINRYKNIAEEEMQRTGVPAAISLAQGILESQAGQGWLVEHSHNHFGIKCKVNWSGPTIFYDDDHKNECFRVYATDDSSWRDHSDFLKYSPRYASLFQLDPLDYKAWAYGLKKAGYATNRAYARQLIEYIEKYNLQQYSETALAGKTSQPINTFAGMLEKKIQNDKQGKGIYENNTSPTLLEDGNVSTYPSGMFKINDRDVVFLPKGTQLIATANKYHIRLTRLMRYNELENDVLGKSQLVYLQKRKKTGAHDVHIVANNESIEQIAAKEGIRLKWLYKLNHLSVGDQLLPGEVLYLKDYKPESRLAGEPIEEHRGFFYKLTHLFSRKKTSHKVAIEENDPVMTVNQKPVLEKGDMPKPQKTIHETEKTIYTVQSGDTLYGLSQKNGITVDQIKKWNNLQSDQIQTGQQLIIIKQ